MPANQAAGESMFAAALDDFFSNIEDEAAWLAGCLLVTEQAALAIARGRWTASEGAQRLGVSDAMIRYRVHASGAAVRAQREARSPRR